MELKIAYVERRGTAMRSFLSFMASRKQQAKAAKFDKIIWANLVRLCVPARRQEEIGYGQ